MTYVLTHSFSQVSDHAYIYTYVTGSCFVSPEGLHQAPCVEMLDPILGLPRRFGPSYLKHSKCK